MITNSISRNSLWIFLLVCFTLGCSKSASADKEEDTTIESETALSTTNTHSDSDSNTEVTQNQTKDSSSDTIDTQVQVSDSDSDTIDTQVQINDSDSQTDVTQTETCGTLINFLSDKCEIGATDLEQMAAACLMVKEIAKEETTPAFVECIQTQECSTWENQTTSEAAVQTCLQEAASSSEPSDVTEDLVDATCTYYETCNEDLPAGSCMMLLQIAGYDSLFNAIKDDAATELIDCFPTTPTCDDTEADNVSECMGEFPLIGGF